jgi:hypothetical protein
MGLDRRLGHKRINDLPLCVRRYCCFKTLSGLDENVKITVANETLILIRRIVDDKVEELNGTKSKKRAAGKTRWQEGRLRYRRAPREMSHH